MTAGHTQRSRIENKCGGAKTHVIDSLVSAPAAFRITFAGTIIYNSGGYTCVVRNADKLYEASTEIDTRILEPVRKSPRSVSDNALRTMLIKALVTAVTRHAYVP